MVLCLSVKPAARRISVNAPQAFVSPAARQNTAAYCRNADIDGIAKGQVPWPAGGIFLILIRKFPVPPQDLASQIERPGDQHVPSGGSAAAPAPHRRKAAQAAR
jgi:hypothetical protein